MDERKDSLSCPPGGTDQVSYPHTASTAGGTASGTTGSSEEIRANIEHTRAEMDETVNALQNKLAPGHLVDQAWDAVKDTASDAGQYAWRSVKSDPLPFALIGLGVAWLCVDAMRGDGGSRSGSSRSGSSRYGSSSFGSWSSRRRRWQASGATTYGGAACGVAGSQMMASGAGMSSTSGSTGGESGGESGSTIGSAASTVREKAGELGERASSAVSSATGALSGVTDRVSDYSHRAMDQVSRVTHNARDTFTEYPLLAGVAAVAVGMAAGMSIPITRREAELMGETRDELLDQAKSSATEMVERGKQVAQRALHTAKDEAQACDVGTMAQNVGEAVKDEAKNQNLTS